MTACRLKEPSLRFKALLTGVRSGARKRPRNIGGFSALGKAVLIRIEHVELIIYFLYGKESNHLVDASRSNARPAPLRATCPSSSTSRRRHLPCPLPANRPRSRLRPRRLSPPPPPQTLILWQPTTSSPTIPTKPETLTLPAITAYPRASHRPPLPHGPSLLRLPPLSHHRR